MVKFGHSVATISFSLKENFEENGVQYKRCPRDFKDFQRLIEKRKYDQIFVYSDFFNHWGDILKFSEQMFVKKSISLVGMNRMYGNNGLLKLFKNKKDQFKVMTHSDNYQDFVRCEELKIPVTVIPNGVNFDEFKDCKFDFRKKYKLEDRKIILCVSNFFPGKGQEHFIKVLAELKKKRNDFIAVFISATVNFFLAQALSRQYQMELKKLKIPHLFLVDIPREHTISAFLQSDLFAFPSEKEVAPIVILEAMAARLPWIAMPVGNTSQLKGGLLVPYQAKNKDGFYMYNRLSYEVFLQHINDLLNDNIRRKFIGSEGYDDAYANYNWETIAEKYRTFFEL